MKNFMQAFDQFKATGCFKLSTTTLNVDQIQELHDYGRHYKTLYPKTHQQFHLDNIELTDISDAIDKCKPITATINTYEALTNASDEQISLQAWPINNAPIETQALQREIEEDEVRELKNKVEDQLFNLLNQPSVWNAIKLDHVVYTYKNKHHDLSVDLQYRLLELPKRLKTLKVFSMKPLPLSRGSLSIRYLSESLGLEALGFEIIPDDYSFLPNFIPLLAEHPKLQRIDLGNTVLDLHAFQAFSKLLTQNYHIEQIKLLEPKDPPLKKAYNKLKKCLLKSGIERFKAERLTQQSLVEVASNALMEGNSKLFMALLSQQVDLRILTSDEKKTWVKQICQALPLVYKNHPLFVNYYSDHFQLDLRQPFAGSKTVGYFLLEKAFAAKDASCIEHLLKSGANLLEHSYGQNSLFKQLFEDKNRPFWKETVLNHLKNDLSLLITPPSPLFPVPSQSVEENTANFSITLPKRLASQQPEKLNKTMVLAENVQLKNRIKTLETELNKEKQEKVVLETRMNELTEQLTTEIEKKTKIQQDMLRMEAKIDHLLNLIEQTLKTKPPKQVDNGTSREIQEKKAANEEKQTSSFFKP
jgi:hypothetical protein